MEKCFLCESTEIVEVRIPDKPFNHIRYPLCEVHANVFPIYCETCGKELESGSFCSNECSEYVDFRKAKFKFDVSIQDTCHTNITLNNKYTTPTESRLTIFARDEFRCVYCGRTSYKDNAILHLEHILARANGGLDIASNLVTSCSNCNLQKGAKVLPNIELILNEVKTRNSKHNIDGNSFVAI